MSHHLTVTPDEVLPRRGHPSQPTGLVPWHSSLMPRGARGRCDVELDDLPAGHGVGDPRQGLQDLGRRRHRVRRPPRRLRRDARRSRAPGGRRGGAATRRVSARTSRSRPTMRSSSPRMLAERFGLPLWRFGNSGTEATMDAIHLMRAITGRDLHHQDRGQLPRSSRRGDGVDVPRASTRLGPSERPASVAAGCGHPAGGGRPHDGRAVQRSRRARARVLHRARRADRRHDHRADDDEHRHHPAAPGYLEGVRALTRTHGVLLDVRRGEDRASRSGLAGVTGLFGVHSRHRLPRQGARRRAAVRRDRRHRRGHGRDRRRPLRPGRHVQRQPAHDGGAPGHAHRGAHARGVRPRSTTLGRADDRPARSRRSASTAVPAYGHRFGAKGCVVFHSTPVRNYRDFLAIDTSCHHCHWLFQHNGGVFLPPWGKSEQWTLSVQHTGRDARRFVANVERFAEAVSALDDRQSARATTPTPERLRSWDHCETRCGRRLGVPLLRRDHAPGALVRRRRAPS